MSVVPDLAGVRIAINYCKESDCPGCLALPVCDCPPSTIPLAQAPTHSHIIEPTNARLVERKEANNLYKHKLKPVKSFEPEIPVEPVQPVLCECPLISCAAPLSCAC